MRGNGIPVIFVSGLGDDHETWQTVQDSITKYALTVSYDLAGLSVSLKGHLVATASHCRKTRARTSHHPLFKAKIINLSTHIYIKTFL